MTRTMKPALAALILAALACDARRRAERQRSSSAISPGASYDIYMRTLARHLGKHLPGNPTVVPQNMAGAGSLRAANFLFNAAPKDGNTIGMFARGLAMQPLLDATGVQYDARKFNWIGSLTSDVSMVLSWHTSPFKSLEDARAARDDRRRHRLGRRQRDLPLHPQRRAQHQVQGRHRLSRRQRLPAGGRARRSRRHRRRLLEQHHRRQGRSGSRARRSTCWCSSA